MSERSNYATYPGLARILEGGRWSIAKTARAVEGCLEMNRDNLRGFFEHNFLLLLRHVFGFNGQGWLCAATQGGKDSDVAALMELLSPGSQLLRAMVAADADGLVQFVFPLERLPTHTQVLMAYEAGRSELSRWPQYAGRVVVEAGRCHLHLNVCGYYLMWVAFYALRGGARSGAKGGRGGAHARLGNNLRKAVDSLGQLARTGQGEAVGHPYLRLLRTYLNAFLPQPALGGGAALAKRGAALAPAAGRRGGGGQRLGEVLLSVAMEFWATDGDEPLPGSGGGLEGGLDVGALRAVSYEPPGQELLDALTVLVRHVTAADDPAAPGHVRPAQGHTSWLPLTPVTVATRYQPRALPAPPPAKLGAAGAPPFQAVAKRVFRLLRRALTLWPSESTSLTPLLELWLAAAAPWRTPRVVQHLAGGAHGGGAGGSHAAALRDGLMHVSDMLHLTRASGDGGSGPGDGTGGYSAEWQAHVLSVLPFFCCLLPLLLDRSLERVANAHDEAALHDVAEVLQVVSSSPELASLLRCVEGEYMKHLADRPRRPQGTFAELLPWLVEQAAEWEAAATANCYGDTPAAAPPHFLVFGVTHDSVPFKMRDLIAEARRVFKPEAVEPLAALAAALLPMDALPDAAATPRSAAAAAAFAVEPAQGIRRGTWEAVRYKGDPCRAPITSYEASWAVRPLVALSDWVNTRLGLGPGAPPPQEVPEDAWQVARHWAVRRGTRLNLRPLADIRNTIAVVLLAAIAHYAYMLTAGVAHLLRELAAMELEDGD